jgi:hypothetical protein
MIGSSRTRPLLLAGVVVALAATVIAALLHETRPPTGPHRISVLSSSRPQPPALTADQERYATTLWAVHREVTPSAVAMSFAGIAYQTEGRNARELARKIEPLAQFFHHAETRVRALSAPASLSETHEQYIEAMALYTRAAGEMLTFTEDGDARHLADAHRMGVTASENLLRVGEVLWPGQYKPH